MGELQTIGRDGGSLSVTDVRQQVNLIQNLMKEVMKPDVHYGKIPGTDKPALYKSGAEKIGLMFRLAASFQVEREDLPGGHREYTVTCRLTARDGTPIGEGIGVCSTMESKYRYRWENTNIAVPPEYWETRDPAHLGGFGFAPRKAWVNDDRGGRTQRWMIFNKVEHSDPADYYNTVAKMAKKRAHVDATLTSTAASDIFDQDIEDPDAIPPEEPTGGTTNASKPKQRNQPREQAQNGDDPATDAQVRIIKARLRDSGTSEANLLQKFEADRIESIKKGQVNDVLAFLQGKVE